MAVVVVAIVFFFVFGVGGLAIWTEHLQKMARIRGEAMEGANREVLGALQSLRHDLDELRDTTTKYDMSFDTALQRLESRMGYLEQRTAQPAYGEAEERTQAVGRQA